MTDAAALLWGVLFGSIGLGFFIYGKKQKVMVPMLSGIGLMAFPYFVSNIYIMVSIGIVLTVAPFVIKR